MARDPLTLDQEVGHYIDMWKQAVGVQMHFNDIAWRIRGLALTVATFALGAAGVAAKDGTRVGWFSLGALVIMIGLLLWYAFYFVDRFWYHPLLKASVAHGTKIEDEIKKTLPESGMTAAITAGSVYTTKGIVRVISLHKEMHSDDKLVWFLQDRCDRIGPRSDRSADQRTGRAGVALRTIPNIAPLSHCDWFAMMTLRTLESAA